jgi:predicted nucleotidyltransferase
VFDAVAKVLTADPRISYALVFGSCARGDDHAQSDLDIAIGGLREAFSTHELGDLIGRLESAAGRTVDLTNLDEVPPSIAYRVFRDGIVVLDRDHRAFVHRKARAVMEYLDWKPVEDFFIAHARRGKRA